MNKYSIPKFHTSDLAPEKYIINSFWGAVPSKGIPPLQVKAIPPENHKDVLPPRSIPHGATYTKILKLNESGYNMFFQPNHLVTNIEERSATWKRVQCKPSTPSTIHALYVDIDTTQDLQSILDKCPLAPQVAISSGNGVHLYFGVEPIHLIKYRGHSESLREDYLSMLSRVQTKLREILGGDPKVSNNKTQAMRIPGTKNIKPNKKGEIVIKECSTIFGNITDLYQSPQYTLEQITHHLNISRSFSHPAWAPRTNQIERAKKMRERDTENAPVPDHEGWEAAYQNLFWKLAIRDNKRKTFQRFFKYVYGFRKLSYYLDQFDITGKSASGLHGETHKRKRDEFISLGLIDKITDENVIKGIAAEYRPTKKFFDIIGEEPLVHQMHSIESLKAEISQKTYPAGDLREMLWKDYVKLRARGCSTEEVEGFLMEQLKRRPRFDENDNRGLIKYLHDWYDPEKLHRKGGSASSQC